MKIDQPQFGMWYLLRLSQCYSYPTHFTGKETMLQSGSQKEKRKKTKKVKKKKRETEKWRYRFNASSIKIPMTFFMEIRQIVQSYGITNSQSNPEKRRTK